MSSGVICYCHTVFINLNLSEMDITAIIYNSRAVEIGQKSRLYNAETFCYTTRKADDCRLSPAKGVTCMRKIDWLNLAISTAGLIASVISIFS